MFANVKAWVAAHKKIAIAIAVAVVVIVVAGVVRSHH